ncbi:MAG: ankyrin repeat domain-containing protein, partial [Spirochaetaceae bacterium]|nr:ankyrin repeat domain-containing protein [Spirochaetaceae bacterium]
QGCTALLLACEWNDTIVCKKLIEAGADITKAVGKCPSMPLPNGRPLYTPNNFLYRAIHFKAWDCLELALTEYKGKISRQMHCGEVQMTPLVYFLRNVQTMEFTEAQHLCERFIPLFQSAGASFYEPTILGSTSDILKMK